jgi:hypothetical protein
MLYWRAGSFLKGHKWVTRQRLNLTRQSGLPKIELFAPTHSVLTVFGLNQYVPHHVAIDIREPVIAAVVAVGQLLMIKPHQMENRRV